MKFFRYLLAAGLFGAMILFASYRVDNDDIAAAAPTPISPRTPAPPTVAPPPTPGSPVPITPKPIPTLAEPLTEEGALKKALDVDSRTARWRAKPWSLDTLRLEPGRVTVEWYSDRSYDNPSNPPDPETGPVWVVTIRGDVQLFLIGRGVDSRMIHESVTYILAQKTGLLLGMRAGPPAKDQPFIPKTATPYYQPTAATTPDALSSSSCTQNPEGLAFQATQQPGRSIIPGAAGPVISFLVRGTGFIPGERVTLVIKGRVQAPGTMGGTTETVSPDSTFATSIGAAVVQPNVPFDLYVIHRRGVACITVTPSE